MPTVNMDVKVVREYLIRVSKTEYTRLMLCINDRRQRIALLTREGYLAHDEISSIIRINESISTRLLIGGKTFTTKQLFNSDPAKAMELAQFTAQDVKRTKTNNEITIRVKHNSFKNRFNLMNFKNSSYIGSFMVGASLSWAFSISSLAKKGVDDNNGLMDPRVLVADSCSAIIKAFEEELKNKTNAYSWAKEHQLVRKKTLTNDVTECYIISDMKNVHLDYEINRYQAKS
ncbi:hypothetical protein A3Q56_07217 [Intoshia linei]|uniref:Uncharacterized protein n=1 Tax=Intoshia linei TaxID=1819745 RepID=A0A177ASW3_9BILA|nr:hypothetical protein A3Q56_07217 [Intoshia linei]